MTNGYYDNFTIIKKIIENGLNNICFSLDSINKEKHDMNRGKKGVFKKVTEAIKYVVKFSSKQKIKVGIAFTYDYENIYEIEDIIRLGLNLKIDYISLMKKRLNHKNKYNFRHSIHKSV